MTNKILLSAEVPFAMGNRRFDQIAAELFSGYSRSRLQQWIKEGSLTVDGEQRRGRDKLVGGETLHLDTELEPEGEWQAENIPLDIIYEDDHILVLNKPAGLVVHPGAGNPEGTLLNALLYHCPNLQNIPRAGIVHRLDKDTSGILVVAKTLVAQNNLVNQLQDRSMKREYEAVVQGKMTGGGKIDEPIGRHGTQRTKMTVSPVGKEAVTHYRVIKKFNNHTHVRVQLETGRTHQIRVHMAHISYPLIGDSAYAARTRLTKGISLRLRETLLAFKRQALHARTLGLIHPDTEEWCQWEAPLPADFLELLAALADDEDYQEFETF